VAASTILFTGAAYAMGSRRTPRDFASGLVMALVLYVGFTRGLDLQLPAGILGGIL
jgi:putative tricarboxylic transport membrane protein